MCQTQASRLRTHCVPATSKQKQTEDPPGAAHDARCQADGVTGHTGNPPSWSHDVSVEDEPGICDRYRFRRNCHSTPVYVLGV